MKVIIIGDGKLGFHLAENLSREDNDVTIIDKNPEALRKADGRLDVMCIKGNGLSTSVLLEAGVQEADILIAATNSDEMNMVCCLTAKKLGAQHTIARIRDPEYADELSQLKMDLDLDMVIGLVLFRRDPLAFFKNPFGAPSSTKTALGSTRCTIAVRISFSFSEYSS